ncbi:MAG: hypothetical protein IGR93_21005 [Hydrococcus sp. C42_A2020_068]|uniref:hypothetical protein n=1 Tax=Pleurocapsa sp. PCC 7327 TaxID=118163 RepID=UPI00029FBA87|nr:hypothetical protein [Pleurocapsa sp. PCC 7327]AFY77081.1 hypothetical protein Ple7327_1722 [Pleurocapsa sp. PCC 7327]MBF2022499.1 hypothetical protein [Hydrococcus sp. C42_A2020_068]
MNSRIFLGGISTFSIAVLTLGFGGQTAQAQPEKFSYEPLEVGTQQTTSGSVTHAEEQQANNATGAKVAQTDVQPRRATRGGSSYIGIGGNIGIGGGSAIGQGSFTVFSKIGLTENLSLRPLGAITDEPTILIPVTYDFNLREVDPVEEVDAFSISPYVGAGVGIITTDVADVGFLLTGGVDIPINPQFTGTAGVNVLFANDTDVGLTLGIGYNF